MYRDGVGGPTWAEKVIANEVETIRDLLENSQVGYKPKIIYCLVDKNSKHRLFFRENYTHNVRIINAGPGTVADEVIVERNGDKVFDFVMVSNKTTVASAQPVLYKVVYNTSTLTKE